MIEEIRRFILTTQEGSITKTAEKVFITQSALSQSIQRLEKALGTKLFVQKGKHLQPTPDGIAVVTIGNKIIELWENAKNPDIRKSLKQIYSIGMFDNAALLLGDYLQKNLQHDSFHLELTIDQSSKLIAQLRLGIIDLAICVFDKKYIPSKDILLVKKFRERLIPVSSRSFTEPLDTVPFILYNKGSNTREQIDTVFIKAGIKPYVFAESTSVTFMKELALLGSGVALLPENFVKAELKQKTLRKQAFPLHWEREYGLYLAAENHLTPENKLVKEIIQHLETLQ